MKLCCFTAAAVIIYCPIFHVKAFDIEPCVVVVVVVVGGGGVVWSGTGSFSNFIFVLSLEHYFSPFCLAIFLLCPNFLVLLSCHYVNLIFYFPILSNLGHVYITTLPLSPLLFAWQCSFATSSPHSCTGVKRNLHGQNLFCAINLC